MAINPKKPCSTNQEKEEETIITSNEPLIPGLPNDVAELCLLRVPYPYQALVRTVSASWNKAITDPGFLLCKRSLSLSLPFLFVFAHNKSTARIQWQALDPRSGRWFVLPPMPLPGGVVFPAPAFSCASLPRHGKLVVLGGMRSDTARPMQAAMVYRTSTNQWSEAAPMLTPRAFFEAVEIGGEILAVGGGGAAGEAITAVERYDHVTDSWTAAADLPAALVRYSSAVVGGELCVTEGWTWPFMFSPRGAIYDPESDTWRQMRPGMREGWTGVSVVVGERLFVISEHGDCPMKVYDPDEDTWRYVGGGKFPCEVLRRPFAASGLDGMIYVVSSGLYVGMGRVYEDEEELLGKKDVKVEWQVVPAPTAFQGFVPSSCQLLYA
ncbi:BTB-kelch protein [Parasponia andersonii]|uniref:BTB-kelch protein n=1 Tax=Parasponia andersonii TaxID=3476 RepID=A0A2P5DIB7_PARAD|nr:BTB-kelch protein [Parasponia andersonii]